MSLFRILLSLVFLATVPIGLAAGAKEKSVANHELREPPVFASKRGLLDILLIARQTPVTLGDKTTTAWVYEVCPRPSRDVDSCPKGSAIAPYGGVRLQLEAGDRLRVRLINHLPPAPPDAIHVKDDPELASNPTNLHTHGLIVEPHRATKQDPTYGDYVYVLGFPAGKMPEMHMAEMDMTDKPIRYDIRIPKDHPGGLFWFHPHAHGISLNQISHGLSGILTIGSPSDYVKVNGAQVRHLILKDMQVLKDNSVLSQEDARFCNTFPFPKEPVRNGFCPGVIQNNGTSYEGGKWFFTLNGQVFPTITVGSQSDLWRITNASGSATYLLNLIDDMTGDKIPFQVAWRDGVSENVPSGMPDVPADHQSAVCPGSPDGEKLACTTQLLMMPASRVEVLVPSRFGKTGSATLVQASYGTGSAGNVWPSVKLAKVVFNTSNGPTVSASRSHENAKKPSAKPLEGKKSEPANEVTRAVVKTLTEPDGSVCGPLEKGHRRRIFLGVPAPNEHGLGYEEINEKGIPVPGTFRDIAPMDHSKATVCLPLNSGNRPVTEEWELVNVSGEDHNFHMHQGRFKVLEDDGGGNDSLYMDSVPVPHGSWGCTGTVARWRRGSCKVKPVLISIEFSQIGDFAYHCHILEHGDAGMMARIRVLANP